MSRTPSKGLKILESLYKIYPNQKNVTNSLVRAYMKLGMDDRAVQIISEISSERLDVESLKYRAWVYHQRHDTMETRLWDDIIDKSYYPTLHGIRGTQLYRGNKEINIQPHDIPLFCVARNELVRLPSFLQYYRQMGVTKFFFTDNNSDDGSFEFLSEQPDCYVFWSNDSYSQAGSGQMWNQYLINKYVEDGQWFLVVDVDEFLIFPECEHSTLPTLIKYLDYYGYDALPSYMLDMYPQQLSAGDFSISPSSSFIQLLEHSPYFYNNYIFGSQVESPYHLVSGGIFHACGESITLLNVTPLFKKSTPAIRFLSSRHKTTPTQIANISSCVLHFKFIGDLYKQSQDEVKRKEHAAGGNFYRGYIRLFESSNEIMSSEKTTKYVDSKQLVDLGLIHCPHQWRAFIEEEIDITN